MRTLQIAMSLLMFAGCNNAGSIKQTESISPNNTETTTSAAAAESPAAEPGVKSAEPAVEPAEPPGESTMSDYALMPLGQMIGTAQLIIAGEVVQTGEGTVTARVDQTLAGTSPGSAVTIRQYIPDKFEGTPRPAPYAAGQSFVWFLTNDARSGGWKIMGRGGEGEMPVENGFVHFMTPVLEDIAPQSLRVHGSSRTLRRIEAAQFTDAVKRYRSCFQWRATDGDRPKRTQICDDAALDQYGRGSALHRHLISAARRK